jgi:DNA-binding NtrC family response regulator
LVSNLRNLPLPDQTLNGRLYQIVDELVRRGVTLEQARREFERQFIVASLKSNRGNFCRSARSLGVHRNTLRNKVSDLGIGSEDYDLPGKRQLRRKVRPTNGSAAGPEKPAS